MEATDLTRRMGDFYLVASEVLRDVGDITEQQISHWIVNPFLVSLGWDPHDKKQVYLDYPVKPEGHVDYALLDGDGHPRLIVEVRKPSKPTTTDAGEVVKKARAVEAPLALITNGQEFALWYVAGDEAPTPLFVYRIKELADNPEALLGLTVDYRLSETGINQLRKSAIRFAVLQMLEDNSEKTFDAMVNWVQSQVAPGALDDTTSAAIREATMIWLTEEHLTMPGVRAGLGRQTAPASSGRRPRRTGSRSPGAPAGRSRSRYDSTKTLDLRQISQGGPGGTEAPGAADPDGYLVRWVLLRAASARRPAPT